MKQIFVTFVVSIGLAMLTVLPVVAVNPVEQVCTGEGNASAACDAASANDGALLGANGVITKIVQFIVYVAGALSVILVVIGGIKYAVSNGDSGSIQSAKNTILFALVGLIVAVFAQAIVSFVLSRI